MNKEDLWSHLLACACGDRENGGWYLVPHQRKQASMPLGLPTSALRREGG